MIEKLDVINSGINVIDRFGFTQNVPVARIYCNKINEIIDIINAITIDVDGTKCVDGSKAPADNSEKANCQENVQPDYVTTTTKWNIQDYLKTPEDLANFLESALEENDYEFLKIAVGDVIAALRRKELLKNLELLANNVFK